MTNDCSRLVAFYRGSGTDDRGRTIDHVLAFSLDRMEAVHDYIQWLFPLDVRSGVNPDAPLVDARCQDEFATDSVLRATLRRALERMLEFYGLLLVQEGDEAPQVVRSPDFGRRAAVWLAPGNHNFLRLTRILKSLRLLGEAELSAALFWCLEDVYREHSAVVGGTTFEYWRGAASPVE